MYQKYFILFLCLFLLGGSLEAKNDPDRNDWSVSNTMSREDHEHHVAVRPSETIDIDEHPAQAEIYSGDGSDMSDDDGSSGFGWDDEDDTEGSAVIVRTKCQREFEERIRVSRPGSLPPPRCTPEGEYERKQCHGSTGHCWCVDKDGLDIGGTHQKPGQPLDCDDVKPIYPEPVGTPKPRKPSRGGFDEDNEDIREEVIPDIPEDREEDIKNSIDNMPDNGEQPGGNFDIQSTGEDNQLPSNPEEHQGGNNPQMKQSPVISQPGLLAGIIGGAVVGLLCAVLLVMFIVYRMRKKDEGSYALDEPKRSPSLHTYARATNREFYA